MALDWPAIEAVVHAWAVAASGITAASVRWSHQQAPVPARPEVVLTWLDVDSPVRGNGVRDERRRGASGTTELHVHDRTHTLQIDVLAAVPGAIAQAGTSARARLGNMLRTLQLESNLATFRTAGLAVWQASGARDLTALVATEFEGRASADITFNTRDTTSDTVGQILTVEGLTIPPSTYT